MSKAPISKDAQIKKLARELVRDSIIEDAASRFVEMVLREAHDSRIKPLQDRIEELEAKLAKAVDGGVDVAASLSAAISLLERGGKKAAASDKMFAQMLADYNASINRFRTTLAELTGGNE